MIADARTAEIRRWLNASPARVFAAFADAEAVSLWLKPSPDVRLNVVAFAFHIGGAYQFQYHVPGGPVMTVNGVFQIIEPPSRIVFSWNIEPPDEHAGLQSVVSVTISPAMEGSDLLIRHAQLTKAGAQQRHAQGWRGALDLLSNRFRPLQRTLQ